MNAEQLLSALRKYAESQGFEINPDEKIVDFVIQGLLKNEEKFGYRYCPCRVVTGDKKQDARIICPCVYHKEEIRSMGRCHCGLFVAKSGRGEP
ncbi:MAG: ferredoxin-thioredoxin reductase catalytic domain-containing protein [Candidatus Hodarchaeaceae archaeon]|nr:ferredoxin-thioredoxin reductase catalytic domain-containing protein [Candidatus Hodarchaeaceae archaeon]